MKNIHPLCWRNCSNSFLRLRPSLVIAVPFSLKTELERSLAKIELDLSLFIRAGLELSLNIAPVRGDVGKTGLDTCFFIVGLYNICGLDTSLYDTTPSCGEANAGLSSAPIGWRANSDVVTLGLSTSSFSLACLCSATTFSASIVLGERQCCVLGRSVGRRWSMKRGRGLYYTKGESKVNKA